MNQKLVDKVLYEMEEHLNSENRNKPVTEPLRSNFIAFMKWLKKEIELTTPSNIALDAAMCFGLVEDTKIIKIYINQQQWHDINKNYSPIVTKYILDERDKFRYWQYIKDKKIIFNVTEYMFSDEETKWLFDGPRDILKFY